MAPESVLTPPCKTIFDINPKILRPSGTDITMQYFVAIAFCDNACVISAPGIRVILGLIANIGLYGVLKRFLGSILS